MPNGEVLVAVSGLRGFDTNQVIDAEIAQAMYDHGYRFAVRYVRRATALPHDLTAEEVDTLLSAGLAVMAVQHVKSESAWTPTPALGDTYGAAAVAHAQEIGLPLGVTVWCDLEGVAAGTPALDVAGYCRKWHAAVSAAGYEAGLYVGWHAGLDADQLYRLPFTHYWGAFNLDADQEPARRGVQMRQHAAKAADVPDGIECEIDTDVITGDKLGGFPTLYCPEGWPA